MESNMQTLKIIALLAIGYGLLAPSLVFAQTVPSVSVLPATQTVNLTTEATVTINVSDVTNLGSYQFDLSFDPTRITVKSVSDGGFLSSTGRTTSALGPTIDNTTGKVTFGVFTLGNTPAGPNGNGTLATITFNTVGLGSSPLNISNVSLTDILGGVITTNLTQGTINVSALAPTPTQTPTTTPTPSPTAAPVNGTTMWLSNPTSLIINTPTTIEVMFSTTNPISGVDALIHFDPRLIQITGFTDNHLLPVTPLIDFNNGSGLLRLSQVINPGQPFTGQGSLATIHFTPILGGQTSLSFEFTPGSKADTNAISSVNGQDILSAPETLTFSIINPADLTLSLSTPSESSVSGFAVTGTLTDQDSTLSAQISTDIAGNSSTFRLPGAFIGQVKTFFYKVSGFLREKFSLTVNPGLNQVNLGLLKAGDLNDDGVINTLDLSLLYDAWFDVGPADFNQDGVVNSADHWFLIQNFLLTNE